MLLHLFALLPVLISDLGLELKFLLLVPVAISYRYEILKTQRNFLLVWDKENYWQVQESGSEPEPARLSPMSFYISWLVVLVLQLDAGATKIVILPADALDAKSFRQLKVRLTLLKMKDLRAPITG